MSDMFDDLDDLSGSEEATGPAADDTEAFLQEALDLVHQAKSVPMSSSALVHREEMVEILQEALHRLPVELDQAREMLREREAYLEETRRTAEGIMEEARVRAERMVQRTEVVRQANHVAQRIVDDANDAARRREHEVDDYVGRQLARFEIVLDRTIKTVQAGRAKLQPAPLPDVEIGDQGDVTVRTEGDGGSLGESDAFFDQDLD